MSLGGWIYLKEGSFMGFGISYQSGDIMRAQQRVCEFAGRWKPVGAKLFNCNFKHIQ
jgi:hypothetical protein